MIDGVKIIEKKVITDYRGKILHMMRVDDNNFDKFGEIYFSYVNPNQIKAWHIHKKMTLNYVAAFGKIKLVLYDDRVKSSTNGLVQEIFLSNDNHLLVSIPNVDKITINTIKEININKIKLNINLFIFCF